MPETMINIIVFIIWNIYIYDKDYSICSNTAEYQIEDPSDLRFGYAALRGSTVNVRAGSSDPPAGGFLTSALDGIFKGSF